MNAVQGLRQQAYSAGHLQSSPQLAVTYAPGDIVIAAGESGGGVCAVLRSVGVLGISSVLRLVCASAAVWMEGGLRVRLWRRHCRGRVGRLRMGMGTLGLRLGSAPVPRVWPRRVGFAQRDGGEPRLLRALRPGAGSAGVQRAGGAHCYSAVMLRERRTATTAARRMATTVVRQTATTAGDYEQPYRGAGQ